MTPAQADPELVRRVLRETGVDQTVPPAPWSGYVETLGEAFSNWLSVRFRGGRELVVVVRAIAPWAAAILLLVVVALVIAVLVLALRGRRRRVRREPPAPVAMAPAALPRRRDRLGWWAELERRLAAGDVALALEALWWWFACSIATLRVDPSWTSGELLERFGRLDLRAQGRALDRMIYGAARPRVDEIEAFKQGLAGLLP
jgi:hypothetical protein